MLALAKFSRPRNTHIDGALDAHFDFGAAAAHGGCPHGAKGAHLSPCISSLVVGAAQAPAVGVRGAAAANAIAAAPGGKARPAGEAHAAAAAAAAAQLCSRAASCSAMSRLGGRVLRQGRGWECTALSGV